MITEVGAERWQRENDLSSTMKIASSKIAATRAAGTLHLHASDLADERSPATLGRFE